MDREFQQGEAYDGSSADDAARLMKAIGNPSRLRILQELVREPQQVCHLEEALGLEQAYVSQQLARLRNEGIVTGDRFGRSVRYRIVDARIQPVLEVLHRYRSAAQTGRVDKM